MFDVAGQEKSKGKSKGVGEVVGGGSDEWIDEVAEHEEVGSEEEDGEEKPAGVEVVVSDEGEEEKSSFFDVEESGWADQHERFIRDWSGDGLLGSDAMTGEAPSCEGAKTGPPPSAKDDN